MEWINTPAAPAPKGAYSQGCIHNGIVYVAGQLGLDPATGEPASPDFEGQLRQALLNVKSVVEAGGSSPCSMKYTHNTSPSPIPPGRRVW